MENSRYDLVFAVTYIDQEHIGDLLRSVYDYNDSLSLLLVLVEQGGLTLDIDQYENSNIAIKKIEVQEIISLSSARNYALGYLRENQISFEHIMFPDDDSTFNAVFFIKYKSIIEHDKCYLIDVFFLNTTNLYRPNSFRDLQTLNRKDYFSAMSVNLVICYSVFTLVGEFDEDMGVGATYGAAEDSDFYLRCIDCGADFYYTKQLFNYHPHYETKYKSMSTKKMCQRFKAYGMGVEYLYCKHKMYYSAIKLLFRAIGGSLLSLFSCNMSLSLAYMYSFYYRLIVFTKKIW